MATEEKRHEPGTEPWLRTLVANHARFRAFLETRVGNPADAEEILQSAFVKGVEKGGDIRDDENAIAWFKRLLRNGVIDHYRKRGAESRAFEQKAREWSDSDGARPEVEAAICQCMHDLLPTMNPDYAALLSRVDLGGASVARVAAETGMTANNVRVKLHRARNALRKQLQVSCGTCTEHGCLDCTCGGSGPC